MRPIDADALMEELEALREDCKNDHDDDGYYAVESSLYIVKNATTLDVGPVVHGHWVVTTENFAPELVCSVCGVRFPYVAGCCMESKMHFCPNCGNPMDGKEDE